MTAVRFLLGASRRRRFFGERAAAFVARVRRRRQLAAWLMSLLLGLVVISGGLGVGIERALGEASAKLRRHPSSGSLHIVEIDARSIAAIDRWPWPRRNYAVLVDQLRQAGGGEVLFGSCFFSPPLTAA